MRRLAIALLIFVLALTVAVGGLLWRLSTAPLSLAWLQPTLQEMVQRSSPFAMTFADPSLVWEPAENVVALQVRDLQARAENGQLVASAPLLRGTVALRPLLLERRIELVRVRIELPQIGLTRNVDGRLALRFDGKLAEVPLGETTGGGGLAALLGDAPGSADPRLANLQLVEVSAPLLQYEDAGSDSKVSATDAVFALTQDNSIWNTSLKAKVGDGRIAASSGPAATPPQQDVTIELQNLQPSELTPFAPGLPLAGLALPVSGTVRFPIDPATGESGAAEIDLAAQGGEIAAASLGLAPVAINEARIRGRLEPGWQAGEIEQLQLVGDGFSLGANGHVGQADGRLVADVTLQTNGLDVAQVLRLWPADVAKEARAWVADNVTAGKLGGATLHIGLGSPRPGQQDLGGSLSFSEVDLRYMDGFPQATGLAGTASLAGDSLVVRAKGGRTGEVDLGTGEITLSNLMGSGVTQLKARADLRSTLPAAMRLLDAKPIELGRQTGLSPDRVAGRQATTITVQLPLIDPLPESRIVYRADARLSNVEAREISPGYSVAADSLTITAQASGVSGKGDARVNGVPLAIDFLQANNVTGNGVQRRASAVGRVDRAAVERLGFTWPTIIGGSVGIDANLVEQRSPLRTVELKLDLGETTANLPELGFSKQRGQAGTATATLVQRGETDLSVDQAQLTIPGWNVQGSGAMRLEPLRPLRFTLTQLRSPLGDLTADFTLASGIWRGRMDIGALDVRPLLRGSSAGSGTTSSAGSGPLPDFTLQLAARRLQLGETPFSNLSGSVDHRNDQWRSARLQANIEGSAVNLDLTLLGANSVLKVRGDDAGWVIRSVAESDHGVRGGRLQLTADLTQAASGLSASGELRIRDFTMWGAPTIARIVSLASFSGLSNALSGRGIPVSRVVAPFRLRNDVIQLDKARLVASDIGARADGRIDIGRQMVDVNGTVAPAYTINRLLGRIPILGALMSGGRSDALLAATFSISGPLDQPQIGVNPLAALVPGVIRDLFGSFDTDPASTRD